MGIEHKYPYWLSIHMQVFGPVDPPYTGVNIMTVKKENSEVFLENLRKSTEFIKTMGGTMTHISMREHGENNKIIWCFYYPEGYTWDRPDLQKEALKNGIETCPEWYSLMEDYDWYVLQEDARTFPESLDGLHRQVPPPSEELVKTSREGLKQMGYTAPEA